jgi:hypothetical protein
MIQHGPMGECWHMHAGKNDGTPYRLDSMESMMHDSMDPMMAERRFRNNSKLVVEAIAHHLMEDEEEKAKTITAAADMVNDFTSWMQRIGNYQTKSMIELADSIRANFGVQDSETF